MSVLEPLRWLDFIVVGAQTFSYGGFLLLYVVAIYVLLHRGFKTRDEAATFGMTIIALGLCTASLTVAHFTLFLKMLVRPSSILLYLAGVVETISQSLALFNVLFADGTILRRMDARSSALFCKRILLVPKLSFILTILTTCAASGIRGYVAILPKSDPPQGGVLTVTIGILQVSGWMASLVTVASATLLTAQWIWLSWATLRCSLISGGFVRRLGCALVVLVESGAIYCISSIIVLFSVLCSRSLAEIYVPIHIQLSGIYPALTIILANTRSSVRSPVNLPVPQMPVVPNVRDVGEKITDGVLHTDVLPGLPVPVAPPLSTIGRRMAESTASPDIGPLSWGQGFSPTVTGLRRTTIEEQGKVVSGIEELAKELANVTDESDATGLVEATAHWANNGAEASLESISRR